MTILLAQAKEAAMKSGRTLTAIIEDALRLALTSKSSQPIDPQNSNATEDV